MDFSGLTESKMRELIKAMYPFGAEVRATKHFLTLDFHLSVQYAGMPEHTCKISRMEMERVVLDAKAEGRPVGCLGLYIHEKLGKPVPKKHEPPAPPSAIRDPYSCGHCGALVSPDMEQCEHCKAWLMPAQGTETKRKKRRSKPPPMKLPPPPQKVLL